MNANLQPYLTAIEEELRCVISAPNACFVPFYNMMAYHLGWLDERFRPVGAHGGKRIRPLLCLLTCDAAGGDWYNALPAAAALELVHNFSLIHDDIEDNSSIRHGRPTVWRVWGLSHGINVGDAMLMLAHQALARLSHRNVDTATVLAAINLLNQVVLELCQGQYLDISYEGHLDITEGDYLQMIGNKTAALIATSTELGARIARTEENEVAHYRQFGWQLGLAFQMVDDLLGIWGDPAITGKPVASDIRSHKMTLPIIFALQAGDKSKDLANLYQKEHLSEEDISQVIAILERAGAQQYVQDLVDKYEASALAALDKATPRQPAATYLRNLAVYLTARQK